VTQVIEVAELLLRLLLVDESDCNTKHHAKVCEDKQDKIENHGERAV